MYVDKLTQFCDLEYDKMDCKNSQFAAIRNCKQCLEEIHAYPSPSDREYDCPKMIYYYVNNFIYRYSSEIQHLFESKNDLFNSLDKYKILSVGCGPCTELFGIKNFISDNEECKKEMAYLGVDTNDAWIPIHKEILNLFKNDIPIKYIYERIDKDNLPNCHPNIVFFQYFISHIHKSCKGTDQLIVSELNKLLFLLDIFDDISYIIINDINHSERATKYYFYFANKIKSLHPKSRVFPFHFRNWRGPNSGNYHFNHNSAEHSDISLKRDYPAYFVAKYNTWTRCTSAQMLIQVIK